MKIHNDHNVYIVGAGYSYDRGMPLVRNFLEVMRDSSQYYEQLGDTAIVKQMNEVFEFRHKAAQAGYRINLNIEDIEQLFSLANAQNANRLDKAIIESICATISYAAKAQSTPQVDIYGEKSRFSTMPGFQAISAASRNFNNKEFIHGSMSRYDLIHLLMFNRLNRPSELKNNAIISFNYDLVIEDSVRSLNIPFHYGMKRTHDEDPDYCNANDGFSLLKLHGSVNWTQGRRGQSLVIHPSYEAARASNKTQVLLPPTWQKTFHGPFQQVWTEAINEIRKATRIIIIGFSMPETDTHFKYLLSAGLSDNISLREIIFVNPIEHEDFRAKLERLFQPNLLKDRYVRHLSLGLWAAFKDNGFLDKINRNSDEYYIP